MSKRRHLQSIKGWWRYRRRWPMDVGLLTEGEFFIRHLNTADLDEAIRLRPKMEIEFWAEVDRLKRCKDSAPRALTSSEIMHLVAGWYREAEPKHRTDARSRMYDSGCERQLLIENMEKALRAGRKDLSDNTYLSVRHIASGLLQRSGILVDEESASFGEFCRTLLRAWLSLREKALSEMKGIFAESRDPLVDQLQTILEAPEGKPKRTLSDLITAYEKDRVTARAASTKAAYGPVFRLMGDVLGSSRDLQSLTREDGRALFEAVKALPRNIGKADVFKGLTVPEAIAKGKSLGLSVIGPATINGSYMVYISAVFGWAVKEQWMTANPVSGLTADDPIAPQDKRDPFTLTQLQALFSHEPWNGKRDAERPGRFWVPLLCLFHGLRLGEAAGLRVEDIAEDNGFPVMIMQAYEQRSLKTESSRGTLPIHPELIRMGFLEHVSVQRAAGEARLFPEVKVNANGKMGAKLGEWFSGLVKKRDLTGRKLGMHSFRHCFEDRLREAELAERTALALARRGEGSSGKRYGDGLSMRKKAEAIEKIIYPGLDLSHLYVSGVEHNLTTLGIEKVAELS